MKTLYAIKVNKQNILWANERAFLIKCPNKSQYHDCIFWHPRKLIKELSKGYIKLLYNIDFKFNLKKYNNRNQLIKSIEINAYEIEEIFEIVDKETYLIVKEPKKIDKKVNIIEELKNEHK